MTDENTKEGHASGTSDINTSGERISKQELREQKWQRAREQEEIDREEKRTFVLPAAVPRLSLGALFMPPIWGAAHGQWATIFFYPLWVFTDSIFMSAFKNGGVYIIGAIAIFIAMACLTIWFAVTAQTPAYFRVRNKYTPEQYAKRERVWAICMALLAVVFIIAATYYNLVLYDSIHAGI